MTILFEETGFDIRVAEAAAAVASALEDEKPAVFQHEALRLYARADVELIAYGDVVETLREIALRTGVAVQLGGEEALQHVLSEAAHGRRALYKPAESDKQSTPKIHTTSGWRDQVIAAPDLCNQVFEPVRFLVPGLFPEGVSLLVSRPKLGKSWLLLQIGSAVAGGVISLVVTDEPACGDVLYLSLEDNSRRVQRRMTKHFGTRRECWPMRLQIATTWRRLDQGGLNDLHDWCASVAKPTLIMIDTLKKVRQPKRQGQTDYDADYEAGEGLVALAHEFPGLAFIVAHHDRKMAADDVFDTVSGTLGLTGGVDTIAILKRSNQGVTLHIQGRDLVEDVEKAVRFDRETCRWTILGEAAEVRRSGDRSRGAFGAPQSARRGLDRQRDRGRCRNRQSRERLPDPPSNDRAR